MKFIRVIILIKIIFTKKYSNGIAIHLYFIAIIIDNED